MNHLPNRGPSTQSPTNQPWQSCTTQCHLSRARGLFRNFQVGRATAIWTPHCWILEEKMDIESGLYFISPDGRGGHPLTVCQYTKDHLCSIIPWPIRWQGYDTLQMILNILGHR